MSISNKQKVKARRSKKTMSAKAKGIRTIILFNILFAFFSLILYGYTEGSLFLTIIIVILWGSYNISSFWAIKQYG